MNYRIILFLNFLSLSVFCLTLSAQKSSIIYAEELYERELIDSAIYQYEVALGQNPSNVELKKKVADLYRITNRITKAVALYEQIYNSPQTDFLTVFNYAYVLKMNEQYDQSKSVLNKLKTHPETNASTGLVQLLEQNIQSCDFALENKDKTSAYHKIMNEIIANSPSADFSPFLFNNQLVFASNRLIKGINGVEDYYSNSNSDFLYVGNRKNNKTLTDVKLLHDNYNKNFSSGASDIAPFTFSSNGKTIISSSNSFSDGIRHPFQPNSNSAVQLSLATINEISDLPKFKKVEFENTISSIQAGYPLLTQDGKTLYFAAMGKGMEVNYGGYDIYVSNLNNGVWSTPQNLGPGINGSGHELSPFVDEEGILYFSSDGHKGFGGFDVFRAEDVAGTWKSVRNLGFGINSPSDEIYFVYDFVTETAYFSSNRPGGSGDYDLYSAIKAGDVAMMPVISDAGVGTYAVKVPEIKENKEADNTNLANNEEEFTSRGSSDQNPNSKNDVKKELIINENKTPAPATNDNKLPCADNVYIGSIIDAGNKQRVEDVWVYIKNTKTGEERKVKSSKYGEYAIVLEPQNRYEIRCNKQGYEQINFEIFTEDGQKRTILGEKTLVSTNKTPINNTAELSDKGFTPRGNSSNKTINENFIRSAQTDLKIPSVGYQIQIGVFKNLSENENITFSGYGNIITEPYSKGDSKVFKLGIFAEEKHAKETLAKIQKTPGYEKAFIKSVDLSSKTAAERMTSDVFVIYPKPALKSDEVELISTETKNVEVKSDVSKTKENTNVSTKTDKESKTSSSDFSKDQVVYKIQLGAYKDPSKAKVPDLEKIGKLEKIVNDKNGLTYFYLSTYKTMEEATKAKNKVEEKGMSGTFIVAFKNGEKINLTK
jgi:tetratricopeptide (TPR) repeat protein